MGRNTSNEDLNLMEGKSFVVDMCI
ncbi:hypothetical protein VTL71DRAFT_10327 [Oculimacula yallundae]|uniref:Uncharacterized protein n=1 Tax=Oculimacula yallundae TaxID=86028 RepID=A0ABR4CTA6_9HELO